MTAKKKVRPERDESEPNLGQQEAKSEAKARDELASGMSEGSRKESKESKHDK